VHKNRPESPADKGGQGNSPDGADADQSPATSETTEGAARGDQVPRKGEPAKEKRPEACIGENAEGRREIHPAQGKDITAKR